jgi:hypothetical protein
MKGVHINSDSTNGGLLRFPNWVSLGCRMFLGHFYPANHREQGKQVFFGKSFTEYVVIRRFRTRAKGSFAMTTAAKVIAANEDRAKRFGDHLESKVAALLTRIEASHVYKSVFDPKADPRYVATVIKHILLEVFSYGPHVTEATFTAIGRVPKNRPDLMQVMINHDLEEVDHGEMALRDFVKLGGDEKWARSRRITPASWAMVAVCRMLAQYEDPFAYLGYMYPFESLTPILTERAQKQLATKSFPVEAQKFIDFHATEDIGHAKVLRALTERVVREYPDAASAIEYGFDCFAVVYPLPIWDAAVARALAEIGLRP